MLSEPPRRTKLTHINTLADVVRLINTSKKIIVLTGAGVGTKLSANFEFKMLIMACLKTNWFFLFPQAFVSM